MADEPIWRKALNDETHPLYQAAWLIFSENTDAKSAAQRLAPIREQVIAFIYQILDHYPLSESSSLGKGMAPVNGIRLLGEWQVREIVPRLFNIVEHDDWETQLWGAANYALEKMAPQLESEIFEFAERVDLEEHWVTVAGLLSELKGNPRAFEWLKTHFIQLRKDMDIGLMAELLLHSDTQAAIPVIEARLKSSKLSRFTRERIETFLKEARNGHEF